MSKITTPALTDMNIVDLNYVCNQIGKRILPQYFFTKSPEKVLN